MKSVEELQKMVTDAGGTWWGLQEEVPPFPRQVIFKTPSGETLSLPEELCHFETIRTKIVVIDELSRIKMRLLRSVYKISTLIEEIR